MQIKVKLVGVFRVGRFHEEERDVPEGITVADVVSALDLTGPLLGAVLINGIHAELNAVLSAGDRLTILPLVDGG
jgi:sulfur carrier protein ThiS